MKGARIEHYQLNIHNNRTRNRESTMATLAHELELRAKEVPLVSLPTQLIKPSPYQPRKKFDPEELQGLAESIAAYGLLAPIVVRKVNEEYELIAGERRLRAVRDILERDHIDARIIDCTDQEAAEIGTDENYKRVDLLPSEKARQALMLEKTGCTLERIGKHIGCSAQTAAKWLRVARMPETVQELLDNRELNHNLIPIIDSLLRSADQEFAAKIAVSAQLTVPELQARINHLPKREPLARRQISVSSKPNNSIAVEDLEQAMIRLRGLLDEFQLPDQLKPQSKQVLKRLVEGTVSRLIELLDSL